MKFKEILPIAMIDNNSTLGYECGVDEAGRGCIAGPVVVSSCILNPEIQSNILLQDSKKLSETQREEAYQWIIENALEYHIIFVDNNIIDKINILQATYLGMNISINQIQNKLQHIIIDGNRFQWNDEINANKKNIPFDCIVKGDSKYGNIAAASILAKVSRDRYMLTIADKYPRYFIDKNKGYPTPEHKEIVKEYGWRPYHRKTFNI